MRILTVNTYEIEKNSFNSYKIYAKKFTAKKHLHSL